MKNSSEARQYERSVRIESLGIGISHKRTYYRGNNMESHDVCELNIQRECCDRIFVGDSIYELDGACVFTFRPGEIHSGINDTNRLHERYIISFMPDCFDFLPDGGRLLRCFFEREPGKDNMTLLPADELSECFSLLDAIFEADSESLPERGAVMLSCLIRILAIVNRRYGATSGRGAMPEPLRRMIGYIDENLQSPLRVGELSREFGVSVSTAERLFVGCLGITPRRFILLRRIEYAKRLLRDGAAVSEACFGAGFGDYSHFIADFRKVVGITPAKYCLCDPTRRDFIHS